MLTLKTLIPDGEDSICNLELSIEGNFISVVDFDTIREDVINEFKTRTGLYLLWPYMRQNLHDITNRLRIGVSPLPLIDMFGAPEPDPEE